MDDIEAYPSGKEQCSRTLALYSRGWFVLLAGRRWEKITAEQLAEAFALLCAGDGGSDGRFLSKLPILPLAMWATS